MTAFRSKPNYLNVPEADFSNVHFTHIAFISNVPVAVGALSITLTSQSFFRTTGDYSVVEFSNGVKAICFRN